MIDWDDLRTLGGMMLTVALVLVLAMLALWVIGIGAGIVVDGYEVTR